MPSDTTTTQAAVAKLLTQRETAELLGVTERTIFTLRKASRLRAVLVGPGAVRFDPRDIQQFIDAAKEGGGHE